MGVPLAGRACGAPSLGPADNGPRDVGVLADRLAEVCGVVFAEIDLVRRALEGKGDRLDDLGAIEVVDELHECSLSHDGTSL